MAASASVAFNVASTLLKIVGAVLTHSVSLTSEAIHSAADVGASALAFFSVRAAAVEKLNDGYWAWEVKTGKAYHSPRWLELLGYSPEEAPGRIEFFHSLVHPLDRAQLKAEIEAGLASQDRRNDIELRLRHRRGAATGLPARGRHRSAGVPRTLQGTRVSVAG